MSYGLYLSAAGADSQAQRIEVISNNLANVNTPGFKRELDVIMARHSESIAQNETQPGSGALDDMSGGAYVAQTLTDYSQGSLQSTGVDTDLAIDGDRGFFMVEHEGVAHLTRAGNFHFSRDGFLRTQSGHAVLSSGGSPVVIDPNRRWEFHQDGFFVQDGARIPVGIAQPQSLGDLARVGENLFRPLGPIAQLVSPQERPRVFNGRLEQSAVRPTQEMTRMIEASRMYESNIKMIQNQDSMTGSLISRLLQG